MYSEIGYLTLTRKIRSSCSTEKAMTSSVVDVYVVRQLW
jgi:hypothetical protein